MSEQAKKVIVVAGPTGSGKTGFAMQLAKKYKGALINADSVQVYRYLDIGSNKGKLKTIRMENIAGVEQELNVCEMGSVDAEIIEGWLFDLVNPDESFTLANYKKLADAVIEHLLQKGIVPILVGGTGLYIDSIVKSYTIDEMVIDEKDREYLNSLDISELKLLAQKDERFKELNNSDQNNPRRLIRLIEGGRSKKSNQAPKYDFDFYCPVFDKDLLNKQNDVRVEQMFEHGLVDEVKKILDLGYSKNLKPLNSLGYRQVISYLDGKISLEECINQTQIATRQYVKRQITWFKKHVGEGFKPYPTCFD